jgi:flagellar biosynthesis/type III secretory pathway protein FliH
VAVLNHAQRVAANIAAHRSTPQQRQANIDAHEKAAGTVVPKPPRTQQLPPASPGAAGQSYVNANTVGQRVARNNAAHQSTPAQRAANVAAHQPVPAGYHAINIPDPGADPDYMQTHADLTHQLNAYKQQEQHGITQYAQQYGQQASALGYNTAANKGKGAWDYRNTTPGTIGAAQRDTSNDFVSRGMGTSTPYATAVQNMNSDYGHRIAALTTGRNQYNQSQNDQLLQYTAQNTAADNLARRTAVANIAAQYGVQPSNVTPGHAHRINVRDA